MAGKIGKPKGLYVGIPKGTCIPFSQREETFWKQVEIKSPDECWLWRGTIFTVSGYGRFCWDGKMGCAHRFAYLSKIGPIEPKLYICHHCDNRLCVNPSHLFKGTAYDNNHDMIKKGRFHPGGYKNITEEQVRQIRAAYIFGKRGTRKLSKLLGLPFYSVKSAIDPKRWKHVLWPE